MSEYLTRKIEAENYIINECKYIKPCLLRPGFIVDSDHRSWSPALGAIVDLAYLINVKAVQPVPVVGPAIDFLFPAKSVRLSQVAHFAIQGALGKTENAIIDNQTMYTYQ